MTRSNPGCDGLCDSELRVVVPHRPREFAFDYERNRYNIMGAAAPDMPIDRYYTWVEELLAGCEHHFRNHPFINEPRCGIYPGCLDYLSHNFAPLGWGLVCTRLGLLPDRTIVYTLSARPYREIPPRGVPLLKLRENMLPMYKD